MYINGKFYGSKRRSIEQAVKAHEFTVDEQKVYTTNIFGKAFTIQEYKDFLYNPCNIKKCEECPVNQGFREGSGYIAGPCGQQQCWVAIHCRMRCR